jgi:predicted MFS family arabinose efflux permease
MVEATDGGTPPMGSAPLASSEPLKDPAPKPSYRRTLANRRFSLLWIAQLVSQSGDFIFEVALLWLVLEITRSPFAVGIIVTGTILPGVLLGPILGVYIDRWDRRRTLLATNIVQGVVVAALSGIVLAGEANLTVLFLLVLMLGTGTNVVRVATGAYVPSVVAVEDLPPANGLLSLGSSMNQIVGLSLGGIFVALFGVALPIEYDALSFFAAAVLIALIPRSPTASTASDASLGFRAELAEGFDFIRTNRWMLEIIVIGVIVNFFGNGLIALIAPYAEFVLGGGPAVYGFMGAAVAVGAIFGAGAMGRANLRKTAGRYLFVGGTLIGFVTIGLGLTRTVPIALALMLSFGVVVTITNIPISVVMQAKIPGRLLGRVSSAFSACVMASSPAGPLFAGWLAQRWSVNGVFLLSGVVITAAIVVGGLTMSSLRNMAY